MAGRCWKTGNDGNISSHTSESHWGVQAMCDLVLKHCGCVGLYTITKQTYKWYITCQKINTKFLRKQVQGGREPGLGPFQNIQVDYTEMPSVRWIKYILVLVGHLTGWVKAYPLVSATALGTSKLILEQIVSQYGLVENVNSNNGSHFTSYVLWGVMWCLGIAFDFDTPWHPPSSGRVERMNQSLKKHPTTSVLETKLPWTYIAYGLT